MSMPHGEGRGFLFALLMRCEHAFSQSQVRHDAPGFGFFPPPNILTLADVASRMHVQSSVKSVNVFSGVLRDFIPDQIFSSNRAE